jgi:hypothetical protein
VIQYFHTELSKHGHFVPQSPPENAEYYCGVAFVSDEMDMETRIAAQRTKGDIKIDSMISRPNYLNELEWYDAMEYDTLRPTTLLTREGYPIAASDHNSEEINRPPPQNSEFN